MVLKAEDENGKASKCFLNYLIKHAIEITYVRVSSKHCIGILM